MNPGLIPQPSAQSPVPTSPSTKPMGLDYQMFVAKGLDLISGQQTRKDILVLLKAGKPVESLANTLVVVLQKLDIAARKKGTEVHDYVKIIGANELLQELAKIAKAARIFDLDKDHLELAFSLAIQDYVKTEIQAGRIDGAKLYQTMQQNVKKMAPKDKQEMDLAIQRIAATAKKYNGGK